MNKMRKTGFAGKVREHCAYRTMSTMYIVITIVENARAPDVTYLFYLTDRDFSTSQVDTHYAYFYCMFRWHPASL